MSKDTSYLPSSDDSSSDEIVETKPAVMKKIISKYKKNNPHSRKLHLNKIRKLRYQASPSETPCSPMSPSPTALSPMSTSSPFTFIIPESSQTSIPNTTASIKLLQAVPNIEKEKVPVQIKMEDDEVKVTSVYIPNCNLVIDSAVFQNILSSMAVCKYCKTGQLKILDTGRKSSCSTYLLMRCNKCFEHKNFWSVSGYFSKTKINVGDKLIPKRNELVYTSVLGGRLIGVGISQLRAYHAALNIPLPPGAKTFRETQLSILIAAEYIANCSMDRARNELGDFLGIDYTKNYIQAVASYDGAYQQRSGKSGGGFSRYCFASAISVDVAKVLSYGISCNSCRLCTIYKNKLREGTISSDEFDIWLTTHSSTCPATYSHLASVHLESAIAPQVLGDALKRGIIFTGIVSDGDNKTHEAIIASDIYKDVTNNEIIRYECLSHVAKRMKTNLYKAQDRILKSSRKDKEFEIQELRNQKNYSETKIKSMVNKRHVGTLIRDSRVHQSWEMATSSSVGIRILSESVCAQIASYYRIAVQRNKGNCQEILKAINAIPYHLGTNNQNAEEYHRFCPAHQDSWCKYQSAKASNKTLPNHPNFISQACVEIILKVFTEFGYNSASFISKISDGRTSNHNESIHSVLFRMIRKTESVGNDLMRLGAALAVIRYNDGFHGILALCETLGVTITPEMANIFCHMDTKRVKQSRRILIDQSKRYHKKQRRGTKTTRQIKKHGPGYDSGKHTAAEKLDFDPTSESEQEDFTYQHSKRENTKRPGPSSQEYSAPGPSTPVPSTNIEEYTDEEENDSCAVCNGTDEDGIVGIGLTIPEIDNEISWVSCSRCHKWFHLICLGLLLEDVDGDEWYCDIC